MATFVARFDTDKHWLKGMPPWKQPHWTDHARFIDALRSDGVLYMAGPLADFSGIYEIVEADNRETVRERIMQDPWLIHSLIRIRSIEEWFVLMDPRVNYESKVPD